MNTRPNSTSVRHPMCRNLINDQAELASRITFTSLSGDSLAAVPLPEPQTLNPTPKPPRTHPSTASNHQRGAGPQAGHFRGGGFGVPGTSTGPGTSPPNADAIPSPAIPTRDSPTRSRRCSASAAPWPPSSWPVAPTFPCSRQRGRRWMRSSRGVSMCPPRCGVQNPRCAEDAGARSAEDRDSDIHAVLEAHGAQSAALQGRTVRSPFGC
jgi:hypothetical protein